MADESIEDLKARIASLSRENQRLTSENTRRKATNRDLTAKLTTATSDLTNSTKERDQLKSKVEKTPVSDNEEIEALKSQVRSYKHKDGMSELAYSSEIGLNRSVPIDKLMRLIDYKPVDEEFNPKAVKQILIDLKTSDPYLFSEPSAGGNGQPQRQGAAPLSQAVAGLGSALGRGSSPSHLDVQALSEEQLRSPEFMSKFHAEQRRAAGK